jgi:hypothetical protein
MNKLKLLKGMDEQERTQALEAVINSDARLFISITSTEWFLVPVETYGSHFRLDQETEVNLKEVLQDATFVDGFLEIANGEAIATELISMKGQNGPIFIDFTTLPLFLDEKQRPALMATFKPNGKRLTDSRGFLSLVIFKITFDSLAMMIEKQTVETTGTKTDPIKVLMMRFLNSTNGEGSFTECWEYLLSEPEIDEDVQGRILWTSYNEKPQRAKKKSMQERFRMYKKEWESSH